MNPCGYAKAQGDTWVIKFTNPKDFELLEISAPISMGYTVNLEDKEVEIVCFSIAG